MANARRKVYEKARNIARNNIDKTSRLAPKFGAKSAHLVIKAYNLYQKQCLVVRGKRMQAAAELNKKTEEEKALQVATI